MSVNIPDRHRPSGPPQASVPPLAPPGAVPGPPQQPPPQRPRRRRRLVLGLVAGGIALLTLVAGGAVLLARSGIIADTDPEGDDQSYLEDFRDTDVPFELSDDGNGSASVQDGWLWMESSVGDMLDFWIVGPMDRAQVSVDVVGAPGSYAGPAIGAPYLTPEDGWYVTAQVSDTGQLYLFDSERTAIETAPDVLAWPEVRIQLEMTYSEDRSEQVFTAVFMDEAGTGVWVSAEESRLSLTLPAREASGVALMVGPMEPAAADGSFETARGLFDNVNLSYDPAG